MDSNDAYRAIEYLAKGDIQHYGILGMKWGVRRYQNKDGTLTKAGRKRAAKLAKQYDKVTGRDISTAERAKTRLQEIKDMSTQELNERTQRMQAERAYLNVIQDLNRLQPKKSSPGVKLVKEISGLTGSAAKEAYKKIVKDSLLSLYEDTTGHNLK